MVHNFSAGPAILPQSVLQEAAEAVRDFNGMGLSILEISHRSPQFTEVLEEATALPQELLGFGDDYAVLYLTGGASTQFYQVPMNLLASTDHAGYVDTGSWSSKAVKEAKLFGKAENLASSKDENYSYIPKGYSQPSGMRYLHLTSNNTIYGTEYHDFPQSDAPIVCDMSSDMFSRPVDIAPFGLIYAGAQKNMGPAGTTLVIVRKDLLGHVDRELPTMVDYRTHIKKMSAFNTPPVYPIYVSMLTMRWVRDNGGLAGMQQRNRTKADLLYNEIDRNPLFRGTAAKEDRSLMNVCFVMSEGNEGLQDRFSEMAKSANISGLKGHRSVGGFRASIYNAMERDSVQVLVDVMQELERGA